MKKFMLFILAAVMAVGFSSFTPSKKLDTFYYQAGSPLTWHEVETTQCDIITTSVCKKMTADGLRRIYFSASTTDPVPGNFAP